MDDQIDQVEVTDGSNGVGRLGDEVRQGIDIVEIGLAVAGIDPTAAESAVRITRKLREFNPRAYVSKKGIEVLSRQQLRFHGHPEDSGLVVVEFIATPDTSEAAGGAAT